MRAVRSLFRYATQQEARNQVSSLDQRINPISDIRRPSFVHRSTQAVEPGSNESASD